MIDLFFLYQGFGLIFLLFGMGVGIFLDRYINRLLTKRTEEGCYTSRKIEKKKLLWVVLLNGSGYWILFEIKGMTLTMFLYCIVVSAMIVLSVMDLAIFEIPPSMNVLIFICGLLHFIWNQSQLRGLLLGFFIISLPLFILFLASKGQAVGGGDMKLMAVCGFLLGWRKIISAFFIGCLSACLFQLLKRKRTGTEKVLAMGPFLSAGVFIAMLF